MTSLSRVAQVATMFFVVVACFRWPLSAQALGQDCLPGFCGTWSEAYDWGIQTCAFSDADPTCATIGCGTDARGEIPHAILVLKNPTASPPEWRVLLLNTGHQDLTTQPWWLWDPATPGDVQPGAPLSETIFCSGHTTLADGRVLFVGGQKWPSVPGGSCTAAGPAWTWIYDPLLNTWAKGPDMTKARYYPSPLLETTGNVLVVGGDDTSPTALFEVYRPAAAPASAASTQAALTCTRRFRHAPRRTRTCTCCPRASR